MRHERRQPKIVCALAPSVAALLIGGATLSCSDSSGSNVAPASASPHATQSSTTQAIDETQLITLVGNTHPQMLQGRDMGMLPDSTPIPHMQLVLRRSAEREAVLDAHIERLHDRKSDDYHRWLTAAQFGEQYGVPQADVELVSRWLKSHGFSVDGVPTSRMYIDFSGTSGQVREAFHTELHATIVNGDSHFGNVTDPKIPVALASTVVGVHALHDFMPHSMRRDVGPIRRSGATGTWSRTDSADFTIDDGKNTDVYAVAPADFATIYNVNPLFVAGHAGKGQTIAVVEDSDLLNTSDVATFRQAFGLSSAAGTFTQENPGPPATGGTKCKDPGENTAEGEAALDAEWAGATAPDAAVILASCADTRTMFGGLIATENLINGATPPNIISMSYGECESGNGATANASYVSTFQQAVAEGISVFVSSGDEGAASCDADATFATQGISVSGFGSTPWNVAVGGTDFMDTYNAKEGGPAVSTYWTTTNTATFGSALTYVPEIPWNDSCASRLVYSTRSPAYAVPFGELGFCSVAADQKYYLTTSAGSGGPSSYSLQPSWQTGVVGLPTSSGGPRYMPDVSLFAANGTWNHYYVYCMTDTAGKRGGGPCTYTVAKDAEALGAGGTSFAAPALAGIQAIINEVKGGNQGNPNVRYYALAATQYASSTNCDSDKGSPAAPIAPDSTCVFNDVTTGDIDLPCTGVDCYATSVVGTTTYYGALSQSLRDFDTTFAATPGWDYATGLGTVNATNLVTQW